MPRTTPDARGGSTATWTVGYTNRQREFPGNQIKTTKYTCATFVPKNLWEQMHKFGNIYFMSISILMYLGQYTSLFVGSINYLSTLGVLVLMMMVTAAMALLDDLRRGQADNEVNRRECTVVVKGRLVTKRWEEIRVGDLIVVGKHEELPADIVVLYSTGSEGTCYVSTANLDGETNLKLKSAVPTTQATLGEAGADGVLDRVVKSGGAIEAEAPQASIYDFSGVLRARRTGAPGRTGKREAGTPLQAGQLLLRGTTLKLTEWVVGVVVYTGPETRMVMNSREVPPMKRSTLEAVTNRAMLIVLATQGLLAAFSSACFVLNKETLQKFWYLELPQLILPDAAAYWCTFFVLYSNMMPISLYPTLEFCHAAHTYFIRNDRDMACKDLQFAAGVRSSNLTEELGQVSYVFSDKTGTLTQNVMEVKRLSVAGWTYGTLVEGEKGFNGKDALLQARDWKSVSSFLEVLAVAHTAMAIEGPGGQMSYEAESPDEVALVNAAARVGLVFKSRAGNVVEVADTTGKGHDRRYKIRAVNAFDSTRKRMSVVVERDGQFHLLAKGADNVMLDGQAVAQDVLLDHLNEFARQGLRTLVFARRQLEPRDAEAWLRTYDAAERNVANRKGALTDAAVEIERRLEVVGASAIEDKLQIGVPAAVKQIREAGIKLWVLTGDKLETARSIGFSSGVLSEEMQVEVLDAGVPLDDIEGRVKAVRGRRKVALMVTGTAFTALQSGETDQFLEVAKKCSVLIACRISPAQKADIVRIVAKGVRPTPVTLAIGDGANDVPMIQEAQIGVGVAGLEGCQAVNSSDFSVGQFRFLTRLLLVHGHWNYRRMCKVTLFTFWRNAVQVLCIFFFTPISAFSGSVLFEDFLRISFNPLGSMPLVATGCFDQDVRDCVLLSRPEFYKIGREGQDFNNKQLLFSMCVAMVHAAVLMTVAVLAFPHMAAQGDGDYYTFGTTVYTCLLLDLLCRLNFLSSTRNWPVAGLIVATGLLYCLYLVIYPCSMFLTDLLAPMMYMVPAHMVASPAFWLCLLAGPTVNQLIDLFTFFLRKTFDEDLRDLESKRREHASKTCKCCRSRRAYRALCDEDSTDSDESAMEGIATTRLAQQRCLGWTPPHISGGFLLGLLAAVGLLLVGAGWASFRASRGAAQLRIHYAGAGNNDPMGTDVQKEVFDVDCREGTLPCKIKVTVPSSMARPILVHYTVSPFHQNFNDYLVSVVPKELAGELVTPEERAEKCTEDTMTTSDGLEIVPCGMQATSLFNDTFHIDSAHISTDGIAWASDKERYNNPPDYPERPDTSWLFNRYPFVKHVRDGMKSDPFIAWMRPSAMNTAWKQYGWLQRDLEEGEELLISIRNNFPVSDFNGSKQLVITEVGPLGGRADGLGAFLIACGVGCYILGAIAVVVGKIGEELLDTESSDGEDSDSAREVPLYRGSFAGSDFQNEAESTDGEDSDSTRGCCSEL